tara:strand:+ start:749 stop:1099 length:351 start_codon:yes stop_codon:yes gene_type:complete
MKKKIICFDLDGVICKTKKNNYIKAEPIKKNINKINELFEKGYFIKIFTARYMGRSKENSKLAKKKGYYTTLKQLKKWNVKFNKLIFGKPSYDLFVDDKSIFYKKEWIFQINKYLK